MNDSPFVPGARVAIDYGFGGWREDFVATVHKNGNFTLKGGGKQQWRPSSPWSGGYWTAHRTGDGSLYSRTSARIWDEAADAELKEKFAAQARKDRWRLLHNRIGKLSDDDLTDAMLDQIEAALQAERAKGDA